MGFKDRVSGGGLDKVEGFMIKMPGMPHRTQLASWEKNTRLRVFPMPLASGGWQSMRNSVENDDFGDAVIAEPCCRKMGALEQFTYITRIPGQDGEDPTTKMCKAIVTTVDNSPHDLPREWCDWAKGSRSRSAKISKVQNCIFFQCAMFTVNGEDCIDRQTGQPSPKLPALLMGTISLLMTFSRMGNTQVQTYAGPRPSSVMDQTDNGRKQLDKIYADMFTLGDWCSPENGRIMRIHQVPQTAETKPHYGIEMQDVLPLGPMETRVREVWTPWDQLLRYHTAEEQIGYLCRAFPLEAVDFALGRSEYEGLLPSHVRGSWQRLQQQMSGAWTPGLPGAAQQQMGGQQQTRIPGAGRLQQPPQQQPPQQQPPQQQPPQQQQQAVGYTSWGNGGLSDMDETEEEQVQPAGPQVPPTPSAFAGKMNAANTPDAAVTSGAVDPAALASTLNMLKQAQENNGRAGS